MTHRHRRRSAVGLDSADGVGHRTRGGQGGTSVNGIVNVTADRDGRRRRGPRPVPLVDGVDTPALPDSDGAVRARVGHSVGPPNGAHTLTGAGLRDAAGNSRAVRPGCRRSTSRNANSFQNEVLAAGWPGAPDRDESSCRTGACSCRSCRARSGCCSRRTRASDASPFLQITNIGVGRGPAGDLRRLGARSRFQRQPLLLRLLHAGVAQPRPGVALHRERHGWPPAPCRAPSSCSTRTARARTRSTTAGR